MDSARKESLRREHIIRDLLAADKSLFWKKAEIHFCFIGPFLLLSLLLGAIFHKLWLSAVCLFPYNCRQYSVKEFAITECSVFHKGFDIPPELFVFFSFGIEKRVYFICYLFYDMRRYFCNISAVLKIAS